jgi:hypothetical protein
MRFVDVLEHMASAFAFAQRDRKSPALDLRQWDAMQPITDTYAEIMKAKQASERGSILTNVQPSDLGRPIRYATLSDAWEEDGRKRNARSGYVGAFCRQAQLHELRGVRLPFISAHHCFAGLVLITQHGTYEGCVRMCSFHPRERVWITWDQGRGEQWKMDQFGRQMHMHLGMQFSARYDWHVRLGLPGAPRLSLPCSPEEARALFKTRDLPPGKERRAALRHWVSEHMRGRGTDEPVAVRQHLRGSTEFTLDAIQCELVPSDFDREKLAEAVRHSSR